MDKTNHVHNKNFTTNDLPDGWANLIIADPPYFETKGAFDFIWDSFEAYMVDVEAWAKECYRLLNDNGTLFWYGSARRIAYAQVLFDKYFTLHNNLVWHKSGFMNLENSEGIRSFAPTTERLLMYSKDRENLITSTEQTREYMNQEIRKAKGAVNFKEINAFLGTATNGGGVASAILSGSKAEPTMVTEKWYDQLRAYAAPYMDKPYQELRDEYESKRRVWNGYLNLTEVLTYATEANQNRAFNHDTVKPETLTRALILTCSNPGQNVLVPFAGSGTEVAMAIKEKRNAIGYEIDQEHAKLANQRTTKQLKNPTLL